MYISDNNFGAKSSGMFKHVNKKSPEVDKSHANNNRIDSLTKQREEIVKKKNALMAKNAEEGNDMKAIKEQLKIYNQQIDTINSQIAQETAAMAKQSLDEQKVSKEPNAQVIEQPKTEAEINGEKLSSVAKLGDSLESLKTVDSIKNTMEGQSGVLETQIYWDKYNRDEFIRTVDNLNPGAADTLQKEGLGITGKQGKLDGLESRILELSQKLGEGVGEVQHEIEDMVSQDFLNKYKEWSKEAEEQELSVQEKEDFMNTKLNDWESDLKENSPTEYDVWKQLTATLDTYA